MEARERPIPRDVALPAQGLGALHRALRREAGALAAIHALHAAGYDSGHWLYPAFSRATGAEPGARDEEAFWADLSSFFARRGWGTLKHAAPHPAIGLLESPDWAEVGTPVDDQGGPACAFSAGLLSGLLTRVAGDSVAVLEVGCRGRGDAGCSFAFGSATAVHELYGHLLEGKDLSRALAEL